MPLLKCSKCHHEYEAIHEHILCDWCSNIGFLLEQETPLEKMCKDYFKKKKDGDKNV